MKKNLISSLAVSILVSACTVDGVAILSGDDSDEAADDGVAEDGFPQEDDGLPQDEEDGDGEGEAPQDDDSEDDGSDDGSVERSCAIAQDSIDGGLPCEIPATSDTLDPVIAWTWVGPDGEDSAVLTPLVANLDDDNNSGTIDLCDTPDILIGAVDLPATGSAPWPRGHLYRLSGDGGGDALRFDHPIDPATNPAIADLDADGRPEILAIERQAEYANPLAVGGRRLVAFDADGEVLWVGPWRSTGGGGALAVADLDGDGSPEILAPDHVADADGEVLWVPDNPANSWSTPSAADIDDDGDLEVVYGSNIYDHDGLELLDVGGIPSNEGSSALANFDDDPEPELYIQDDEHLVIDDDGSVMATCPGSGGGPMAVYDIDGDGRAEVIHGSGDSFKVYGFSGGECEVIWSKQVNEVDALSSGTAFDLLGDGYAEAIYADLSHVRVYSHDGDSSFSLPRTARVSVANPVVADIDNDGAAEIVVVSSEPISAVGAPAEASATLIVIENSDDRWAPSRRIWNQHTYHRTNVREDARVPVSETPHWLDEPGEVEGNNFRTNTAPRAAPFCLPESEE